MKCSSSFVSLKLSHLISFFKHMQQVKIRKHNPHSWSFVMQYRFSSSRGEIKGQGTKCFIVVHPLSLKFRVHRVQKLPQHPSVFGFASSSFGYSNIYTKPEITKRQENIKIILKSSVRRSSKCLKNGTYQTGN